jgi:hypothetical protein
MWQEAAAEFKARDEEYEDDDGLRARNVMMCLPRDISPSSCLAHEGSASTYLNEKMIRHTIRRKWTADGGKPEPVHVCLWLREHDVDGGGPDVGQRLRDVGRAHDERAGVPAACNRATLPIALGHHVQVLPLLPPRAPRRPRAV